MSKPIWHRPDPDRRWHAYDRRGESLCRGWCLVGIGQPKDARQTRGPGAYCTTCKKAAARLARWQREARKRDTA